MTIQHTFSLPYRFYRDDPAYGHIYTAVWKRLSDAYRQALVDAGFSLDSAIDYRPKSILVDLRASGEGRVAMEPMTTFDETVEGNGRYEDGVSIESDLALARSRKNMAHVKRQLNRRKASPEALALLDAPWNWTKAQTAGISDEEGDVICVVGEKYPFPTPTWETARAYIAWPEASWVESKKFCKTNKRNGLER